MASVPAAFAEVAYTLSCLYALVALVALLSLAAQSSVTRFLTGQKVIFLCAFLACGARSAFFAALPAVASRIPTSFFLVQVASEDAPLWLAVLDSAPAALELWILASAFCRRVRSLRGRAKAPRLLHQPPRPPLFFFFFFSPPFNLRRRLQPSR